jgi:PAS domain S-box-containing protein
MQNSPKIPSAKERIAELERELAEARQALHAMGVDKQMNSRLTSFIDPTEALRRYELLASNSRDIILFIHNASGRILEANLAAVQAYGYTHAELQELTIRDLRAPMTQKQIADQMNRANTDGLLFETVHQRKDGTTFPVEVSSRGALIAGEPTLLSVIRDISERKRVESELRKNEALYRTIVNSIPQSGIWVVDPDLRYLTVDGSVPAQLGYERNDMEGRTIFECLTPEIAEIAELRFRLALAGHTDIYETSLGGRYLVTQYTPLLDEEGNIFAALAVTLDLTERKREEERLRENEERLRLAYEAAGLGTWDWQPVNAIPLIMIYIFEFTAWNPTRKARSSLAATWSGFTRRTGSGCA